MVAVAELEKLDINDYLEFFSRRDLDLLAEFVFSPQAKSTPILKSDLDVNFAPALVAAMMREI